MRRTVLEIACVVSVGVFVAACLILWLADRSTRGSARVGGEIAAYAVASDAAAVERGRYLAVAADCVSCHTRPEGAPFSGGRAFDTPFGRLVSPNVTPDDDTGIGRWSAAQFARAVREGIAANGEHLYPVLPYTAYTRLSDADVAALYAYMRSLPAVRYTPPANDMAAPFGNRRLLAVWKALFFRNAEFQPNTAKSPEWNRGAYLVEALAHCSACHSPRNLLGAERPSRHLAGGIYSDDVIDEVVDDKVVPLEDRPVRLWSAANLTPAANGLGAWSVDDIENYLKSGHNPRAGAFGPMTVVIANSTSRLTAADQRAIAVYLKDLAPDTHDARDPPAPARVAAGAAVYTARCGDCHQSTGLGMPNTGGPGKFAPPLKGNAALQAPHAATLINVVLYGAHGGTLAAQAGESWPWPKMSGFELSVGLDDEQIAALCTYVRSSWGNRAGSVSAADVARQH